jgi:hypothetical protein
MDPIMLLNRIAMFLLMIMVFLTGFSHCKRLDTESFSSFIKRMFGVSGNTFTPAIGVLDTRFNFPNGFIIQPIGSYYDYGVSLAIQPDGKILLGGYCSNGSNWDFCIARSRFNPNCRSLILSDFKTLDFCIARFNSDGTLDTTFGISGKVIQSIGSSDSYGYSLAIQIRR